MSSISWLVLAAGGFAGGVWLALLMEGEMAGKPKPGGGPKGGGQGKPPPGSGGY